MNEKFYKISKAQCHKVNSLAGRLREFADIQRSCENINPVDVHDNVFDVLDVLKPASNDDGTSNRLMLRPIDGCNLTTHFFFRKPLSATEDISKPTIDDDNIFDYINVPNTAIGIWQAFVLDSLWRTKLPLFDHSNYERINLILSEKDFPKLDNSGGEYCSAPKGTDISFKEEYLPYVVMNDNGVSYLHFHYFNSWMGVVKCHHRITISKGGKIKFGPAVTNIVIPYNCGICF